MKKYKKITAVFLAVIMLLSVMPIAGIDFFKASAATLPSSGQITNTMSYTFDSSTGTLTISGTGNMSDYSRTKSPFYNNSSIKTVIIEDGITSIGDGAFDSCTRLTSITIPDSVTSIGDEAFHFCTSLTSITIPASVTSIGDEAFDACTSLTSIEIPDSVTSIGDYAFYNCNSLTSITIPASVTSIGNNAFCSRSNIENITVDENNMYYCSDEYGVLYNKDKTELFLYPAHNSRTSFDIPDSVTSIGDYAFYHCDSLTDITIPDSVTSIGAYAFSWCDSLTSITIPDSVTSIGDSAFSDCYGLTSVKIPDSVTSIGNSAFGSCDSLTSITIPDSVTSIGEYAFYSCDSLTSITIPDSVTSIGDGAFEWCYNLYDVIIGNSVNTIGVHAFAYCRSLSSITIPDSVWSIDYGAFVGCNLCDITISGGLIRIGNNAFSDNPFTDIYYNGSIDSWNRIEFGQYNDDLYDVDIHCWDGLFNAYKSWDQSICYTLNKETGTLTISGGGDKIEGLVPSWFYDSYSIKNLIIGDRITSIGVAVFHYCYSLTDVYYNGTIEQWNAIDIEAGNEELLKANIHCKDGMLCVRINQDRSINYIFNEKTGTLTISGTGNIDMNNVLYFNSPDIWQLFADYSIKDVIIENGITSIGDWAFAECFNLKSIEIPDSVTSIGERAFNDCYSLESITIPASVTSIGDSVFYNCYGLTSVTIPDSVTSIGPSAFYNCYQLTDVYYGGTEEEWNAIEIESNNDYLLNANIHFIVPDDGRVYLNDTVYYIYDEATGTLTISGEGDMPDYSYDDSPFRQLGSIKKVTVKGNVTRIGDYAFYQNENITDVTISSELRSIGYEAFLECTALENITFPESLTEIGEIAFKGCSSIEDVIIPDSVTSIGMGAFIDCPGIKSMNVGAGNSVYDSRNNCNAVIETATNTLVLGCVNTIIPDNITSIGMASFMYCNITDVVIPEGVTSICDEAFACCKNLESVSIPSTVTSIGHIVFYTCPKLSDIYYNGTKYQWKAIEIGEFNINLQNATIHFITVETDPITEDCGLSFDSPDDEIITLSGFTPGTTVSDLQKMISDGWTVSVETVDGSDRIGTGSVITLTSAEGDEIECIAVVYGDTTGDSWYDGTDSLIVNCISNGLLSEAQVGEAVYAAADCNHDDVIDENDVALLEQAGLILANVDQSKTPAELFEDAAFCEYINLIDQSPVTAEKTVEEAPTDTTPTVTKTLLQKIIDFIIYIFKIITSNIPKVF